MELQALKTLISEIAPYIKGNDTNTDILLKKYIHDFMQNEPITDAFGFNPIIMNLKTIKLFANEIGVMREALLGLLLYSLCKNNANGEDYIKTDFGDDVAHIVHGLNKISELYQKNTSVETENFRNLMISFAADMRVILIMIADRVNLMRSIGDTENIEARSMVAREASFLYAPLAHKLGLYSLKKELEDLSLKYLEPKPYFHIQEKLHDTEEVRNQYIQQFVKPINAKLEEVGMKFHIKARTKSIHSIWQKMKKQKCEFEGVYDIFAIRIIIDSPEKAEKMLCWQAYSIVTDMYQPNPNRLRDWLSVPKTNGYESLHITVLGPDNKWVEVQIRTERMDDIAEHGLAAHWRYKGVKTSGNGIEDWLSGIRAALESNDDMQLMDQFRIELDEEEVYAFTPKGDLLKFPKGSTVLDFAYRIHSRIGNQCTGAKINGKVVSIRQELRSGDEVEIITSSVQSPRQEWLKIVKCSHAKSKIRLALKEQEVKQSTLAKEMIERRFKNNKIDIEESLMMKLIKKLGYKRVTSFYKDIADKNLEVSEVIDKYIALRDNTSQTNDKVSADTFDLSKAHDADSSNNTDELIIDRNLKGIDYQLAKCCNPVFGDSIFAFVTATGGIKIHRENCPNATDMKQRFGYRILKARWNGKGTSLYDVTLKIIGKDDIGIVNNISRNIIVEEKMSLRSININSDNGLFSGTLVVSVHDTSKIESLIKNLKKIKGVRVVERI